MMPTATQDIRSMAEESVLDDLSAKKKAKLSLSDPEELRVLPGRRVLNHPTEAHYHSLEQYQGDYAASLADPSAFWSSQARSLLHWHQPFTAGLEGGFSSPQPLKWFSDGTLNVAENCLDRHVREGRADDLALIWESDEPGINRTFTFSQLLDEVTQTAALLLQNFPYLKPTDTVTIYMPMIPETVFVMLACARLGLIHNVVFAGFSAEALRDRIEDAQSKLVITAEYGMRGGKRIPLRSVVEEAISTLNIVSDVLLYDREASLKGASASESASDKNDASPSTSSPSAHTTIQSTLTTYTIHHVSQLPKPSTVPELKHFPAEHPLFMLYTSGSTGRPKGLLHTSAGYLLYAAFTARNSFDLHRGDVFGCLADVGWITGHSYIVYGPLALGITTVLFESIPTYPTPSRYWDTVQRLGITQLYTAPTVIRALRRFGEDPIRGFDLSKLRVLGSVGEPIGADAWMWYWREIGGSGTHEEHGESTSSTNPSASNASNASTNPSTSTNPSSSAIQGNCSVVDTFWQTETGGHVIAPLPAIHTVKPGAAGFPCVGIDARLLDPHSGAELEGNDVEGVLVIAKPWPGMARSVYGDHQRFLNTYLQPYPGYYFTGDAAYRDRDGQLWIRGRVDDVINVSGHRLSTAEIEAVLGRHESCAEAAVLGRADDITGQSIWAFCIERSGSASASKDKEVIKKEMIALIRKVIGPIATPRAIILCPDLPKTRSGKIMRRLVRKMLAGERELGDLSTLSNPDSISQLRQLIQEEDSKEN